MMGHHEKMRGGNEYEALHRKSRQILNVFSRLGVVKKAKKAFNRRVRKDAKRVTTSGE